MKYSIENCREEALKYESRSEFREKSINFYSAAVRYHWLDAICSHMILKHKPKGYWTYEKCKEEALKFNKRSEFAKSTGWAYNTALQNGWLDEICSHMIVIGNIKKRCIYVYEFEDNHAYIGLTYNLENRQNRRLTDVKDAVYQHIFKTNLTPIIKQLTDYVDINDAVNLENFYYKEYINNGWIMLNRIKTGSTGSDILKWDYDKCKEIVLKLKYHTTIVNEYPSVLNSIRKNRWDDIYNLIEFKYQYGVYTYEYCKEIASNSKSKKEFLETNKGAYRAASRNGWLEEFWSDLNIKTLKSPLYYEISDELFQKILNDRNENKKSIETLAKEYKIGPNKIREKFKEKNIIIKRIK